MTGSALVPHAAEAGEASIMLIPLRQGGFACKSLTLKGSDRLVVRFEARERTDWIEVTVGPLTEEGRVFRRLEHCAVRYRGALASLTEERRTEVLGIVLSVAASIDALLANNPGKSLAEALGRGGSTEGRLVFGRDALRALLSPEIVEGVPLAEGFSLADVYPTSHLNTSHTDTLELVLDFRRDEDGRRLLLVVKRRDDTRPAFATTAHFSVMHLSLGAIDPPGADTVRALVAFVLQLRDHEGLDVVFPDVTADVATALLAPPDEEPPPSDDVLNLAIDAACGQSCAFCSIQDTAPAVDGGEATLARLLSDLDSNRRRGVRRVRINGYDPLAFSRILEVMSQATALGYTEAHVFSPCTRLADPAFCDEVIAALPPSPRFHVPLYSLSAEAHDRIVGREGAHALVMQAIENLSARLDPECIWILSVATRSGLAELPAVARYARERGLAFHPHMPYPSFESRADRFFTAAPRMSEVAEVMVASCTAGERLDVQGVTPCAVFPVARRAGLSVRAWLDTPENAPALPGTEYRDERFRHRASEAEHAAFHAPSVPCPHAGRCVLVSACPGHVLRGYAELYGLDELRPISLGELVDAV